jgi:hypothetical protein
MVRQWADVFIYLPLQAGAIYRPERAASGALAAADSDNDFQAVTGRQHRLSVTTARYNIAVPLNRHAFAGQAELFNEFSHRQRCRKVADFAIDCNFHGEWILSRSPFPRRSAIAVIALFEPLICRPVFQNRVKYPSACFFA